MGPWIPAQYPIGDFSCPSGSGGTTARWDVGGPWNGGGPVVLVDMDSGAGAGMNGWATLGLAVVAGVLIGGMVKRGKP